MFPAGLAVCTGLGVTPAVLVIEDDTMLRELLEQALHREGFAPITAPNGAEALLLLRSGVPAKVILLDLLMPVMDGWTFRREQRSDPRLADIPVIVTSGVDRWYAPELLADTVFCKPLDLDQVIARVRALCGSLI